MPNPPEARPPSERILVTGANGHLGRRLLERLAQTPGGNGRVRALVRSRAAAAVLERLPDSVRPEIVIVDYTDSEALARAAAGCAAAVHLVGILRETRSSRYADAHEATTQALARAAPRAGLRRIVYLSILGSHANAANACLASKGRAEDILLAGATPALVLRVPMVIGAGDFVSRTLRRQARARVVPLLRGGSGREQPIDADDVVAAILAGLERPGLGREALDLAGPESLAPPGSARAHGASVGHASERDPAALCARVRASPSRPRSCSRIRRSRAPCSACSITTTTST